MFPLFFFLFLALLTILTKWEQSWPQGEAGKDALIITEMALLMQQAGNLKKKHVLYTETEFLSGHLPNSCNDSPLHLFSDCFLPNCFSHYDLIFKLHDSSGQEGSKETIIILQI